MRYWREPLSRCILAIDTAPLSCSVTPRRRRCGSSSEFSADRTMHLERAGVNNAKRLRREGIGTLNLAANSHRQATLDYPPLRRKLRAVCEVSRAREPW